MVIVLQRKITSELLTTYLPTVLLICIAYATTYFKREYFEAAVGTNLTIMLVMTTIFTGKADTLPVTAYVKHIDTWLIMAQLIPFLEVILITVREHLADEDFKEPKNTPIIKFVEEDLTINDVSKEDKSSETMMRRTVLIQMIGE